LRWDAHPPLIGLKRLWINLFLCRRTAHAPRRNEVPAAIAGGGCGAVRAVACGNLIEECGVGGSARVRGAERSPGGLPGVADPLRGWRPNTPLKRAENALALDGSAGRYHRQMAEASGAMAQHANVFQRLLLARRFQRAIDAAAALDGRSLDGLPAEADAAVPADWTPHHRAAAAMLRTGRNLAAAQGNLRKYLA
jgi:hypothetical protein